MSQQLPLTSGRVAALCIGVPISLVLIIAAAYNAATKPGSSATSDHPARLALSARGGTDTASANYGALDVARAPGGRLRLSWTVHYAHHHPTVTWRSAPSGVAEASHCRAVADCVFSYQASLPAGLPAKITDDAGNVSVTGLASPVTVTTQAGSITATALSGTVHLQTQAGDITGDSLTGPLTQAADQAGDIRLSGLSSPVVTASEQAGGIALTFAGVPQRVSAASQMGDIRVTVPPGPARYWAIVSSDFGHTDVTVPTSQGSAHVIRANTSFGDVTIAP